MFSRDELTLKRNKLADEDSDHDRACIQKLGVDFWNITDLRLPPTASMPRQILKAEAPLVV